MKKSSTLIYELEKLTTKDLEKWNKRSNEIKKYVNQNYQFFAEARSRIFLDLKSALLKNCTTHTFINWQRIVSWRYTLHPLSAIGSSENAIGGRFNLGKIDPSRFPYFCALYIAEDRDTAFREKHGIPISGTTSGLTQEELALTKPFSETVISVSGSLYNVLDITNKDTLKDYFNLIKSIKLPPSLAKTAKKIKFTPMQEVKSLDGLYKTIYSQDWRQMPILFSIPANCQILGHIAYEAGIEGIIYTSVKDGKKCAAIFPRNFNNSSSCVEIDRNKAPSEIELNRLRLDKNSYRIFI